MLAGNDNCCHFKSGPFMIGVSGGTSSGKTSVCHKIIELLGENFKDSTKIGLISQESFYKILSPEEVELVKKTQFNFDHPDAFDTKCMKTTLTDVSKGKKVFIPVYDFKTHSRLKDVQKEFAKCDVVLFEGILPFYHKEIRDLFDMKLFVDSDADIRLSRRVLRDITERGRTLESVLSNYTNFVKPAFEEFCLPTKKFADVIIPRGAENTVAINLIVQHIYDLLNGGGVAKSLKEAARANGQNCKTNGYHFPEVFEV